MKLTKMKLILSLMLIMAMVSLILFPMMFRQASRLDNEAMAAVSNPSPASPGYFMVVLSVTSDITATVTNMARFKMPWPATLIGVSAIVRNQTAGGVATLDVTEGGVSVLSSPISLSSSAVTEGTISDSAIADEATIGITLTVSSGTWTDPTVQLDFKRL